MSESKTAKKAILDKFRQILVFLYQRRPKKMSENAERPAKSGRGSGQKERPTASSVRSRPRSGQKERPTASSGGIPAAEQVVGISRTGSPAR